MLTITRRLEFDYAHRVLRHESKCRHLHGHRGVLEVTLVSDCLDALGRVIDFGEVKRLLQAWVDERWDHNIILHPEDPLLVLWRFPDVVLSHHAQVRAGDVFMGKEPYLMPDGANPTAEYLAKEFASVAPSLLPRPVSLAHVRFYETPNCWADYTP